MAHPLHLRRTSRGYSLIECLLASALLAGVLVSISGLFIVGTKSVRSGRELTKATTLANSVAEQVMGWPYEKVYGFAGAVATDQTKTWDTNSANPAYTGSTQDVADWTATANDFRSQVQSQLQAGHITYRVDGMARLPAGTDRGLTTYQDAGFLRMTVTVSWTESGGRQRQVQFEEITL